jgi:hypothetical protein
MLRQPRISRVPCLAAAQVLDKNEPEQFIEKAGLTEAKKTNLSNLLKTNDRAGGQIFCCQRTWIYR